MKSRLSRGKMKQRKKRAKIGALDHIKTALLWGRLSLPNLTPALNCFTAHHAALSVPLFPSL